LFISVWRDPLHLWFSFGVSIGVLSPGARDQGSSKTSNNEMIGNEKMRFRMFGSLFLEKFVMETLFPLVYLQFINFR
jgi:hypothetical protein